MNDEYIYQYPAPEYMERFKEMVAQRTTNTNGARKKVIVCFGISMAFLVLYCLPFLNFIDTYLLLVAVIFLCATVILLKGITKKIGTHNLMIQATESDMVLTYYSVGATPKKVLTLRYEDIIECQFFDKSYTKIQITFKKNKHSYLKSYSQTGGEVSNLVDTMVSFELNPYSYEQGFFMYIAPDYFNIKKNALTDKILKKYGNINEYFTRLAESEEVE